MGLAGAEVDKLAETKGMDFVDRERAKHAAKQNVTNMYDQQYGGNDCYDPWVFFLALDGDRKGENEGWWWRTMADPNNNLTLPSTTKMVTTRCCVQFDIDTWIGGAGSKV